MTEALVGYALASVIFGMTLARALRRSQPPMPAPERVIERRLVGEYTNKCPDYIPEWMMQTNKKRPAHGGYPGQDAGN